jgi:uncharacterized protein (DUF924 family)
MSEERLGVYDDGTPQERRQEENKRQRDAYMLDAWKTVMADHRGRAVLFDILTRLGLRSSPYNRDASALAFNAAALHKAIELRDVMRAVSPELYETMERENPL